MSTNVLTRPLVRSRPRGVGTRADGSSYPHVAHPRHHARVSALARVSRRAVAARAKSVSYDASERVRVTTSLDEDEILFEFDAEPPTRATEGGAADAADATRADATDATAVSDAEGDVVVVSVDEGKRLLEREQYLFVDCRSWKEYDRSHITKPPQQTVNVPLDAGESASTWAKRAMDKTRKSMKLLIVDADGARARELTSALMDAGYTSCVAVDGGYAEWTSKYTTFGRPVPPKGRFVSTGKEALKSGLDLDDVVAAAYEENWGKEPPKYGAEVKKP